MKQAISAAALLFLLPITAAQAMDVATFLTKAEALQRKGPIAMAGAEARSLMSEVQTATRALKAERLAAEAAGRRPAYCPVGKAASIARRRSKPCKQFRPPRARVYRSRTRFASRSPRSIRARLELGRSIGPA